MVDNNMDLNRTTPGSPRLNGGSKPVPALRVTISVPADVAQVSPEALQAVQTAQIAQSSPSVLTTLGDTARSLYDGIRNFFGFGRLTVKATISENAIQAKGKFTSENGDTKAAMIDTRINADGSTVTEVKAKVNIDGESAAVTKTVVTGADGTVTSSRASHNIRSAKTAKELRSTIEGMFGPAVANDVIPDADMATIENDVKETVNELVVNSDPGQVKSDQQHYEAIFSMVKARINAIKDPGLRAMLLAKLNDDQVALSQVMASKILPQENASESDYAHANSYVDGVNLMPIKLRTSELTQLILDHIRMNNEQNRTADELAYLKSSEKRQDVKIADAKKILRIKLERTMEMARAYRALEKASNNGNIDDIRAAVANINYLRSQKIRA